MTQEEIQQLNIVICEAMKPLQIGFQRFIDVIKEPVAKVSLQVNTRMEEFLKTPEGQAVSKFSEEIKGMSSEEVSEYIGNKISPHTLWTKNEK